ncbi:MAG TPA: FAD-dependent oxidoreductase [Puia sp.]
MQRDGTLTSLWEATTDAAEVRNGGYGEVSYDVVIVGGGITGLSTAVLLQEAGFKCVVLEAQTLCFGTTGGTTAHLNTVLDTSYPAIVRNFNQETAGLVARSVEEAIALIKTNCEKFGIDAGFEEQTAFLFSQDDKQTRELEEIRQVSAEVHIDIKYTDGMPVNIPKQKVVEIRGQAKFHPTRYVMGLAKAFQDLGGRIIEHCRVTEAENEEPIAVHTDLGDFSCTYLIYATHIPPGINLLDTRCAPYRSYAMAVTLKEGTADGLKGVYPDGLIYDMHNPYHYYRTQEIDGKSYLIVGGEDHKTGHEENAQACLLRLEAHVREYFPVEEVVYKWSSQYFEPVDGLPYIGHLPGQPGNILVATGFSGNGMVFSGVSALLFRSMLLKEDSKYLEVYDPNRFKPIAGFSNFVKENVDVGKKRMGRWLSVDKLDSFADMAPGEGRVVKVEGETVALYKDESGKMMALSPVCSHMGCHVAWNNAEKTWDCPCHGARYGIDGVVLTGPAAHGLEKIDLRQLAEKKS